MTAQHFGQTSIGLITFDALCWPVTQIPPGVLPVLSKT